MNQPSGATTRGRILVVDDEAGMRSALRDVLRRRHWEVEIAEAGEEAVERLQSGEAFDLMITDFRMGGMSGLELTRRARALRPALPIVMMTAYGTVEDAVAAMKEGVDDYLLKPFSFETVVEVVEGVTTRRGRNAETAEERPATRRVGSREDAAMVGRDPAWRRVVAVAEEVADSGATVLLMGESGTGKEVLARRIHDCSGRRGPFVAVNCAALPEGVLESELFGHEKGAFTGAVLARKGRFELADGGTILLDEVSEMPLALQAKLLRVIQEREVHPIGGSEPVQLDLRIIATTNRNLEEYVREGNFRQDLYYRLNVIAIRLPALRERPDDVMELAGHFLEKFRRPGRPAVRFGEDAVDFLRRYSWPGNVRELENVVERASLLARGDEIGVGDLHMHGGALETGGLPGLDGWSCVAGGLTSGAISAGQTLEEMEKRMILQTLDRFDGNRTRTAEALGVSVRTIRNKLNQYGVRETFAGSAQG